MKAICVDDEAKTLEYTVNRCREVAQMDKVEGYTRGREALEWLKDHPIDIAFLDIDMPDMDGITLAARIKEMYPNTAIVFLTAYKEFAYDAMSVRPSGYLLKPLTALVEANFTGKDYKTKICIAELGNDAGIIGAAMI